jgi:hypothetical protein
MEIMSIQRVAYRIGRNIEPRTNPAIRIDASRVSKLLGLICTYILFSIFFPEIKSRTTQKISSNLFKTHKTRLKTKKNKFLYIFSKFFLNQIYKDHFSLT